METINWTYNHKARNHKKNSSVEFFSPQEVKKAWDFQKSFAAYNETPLQSLSNLASDFGVSGIYVKDESYRFGLNAFKVLGGSYAIGRYLADRLNMQIEELSFDLLRSKEIKKKLGEITFTTATDGNHGRGIAWAARQLGHKAVVYMPRGTSSVRLENIKATGAEGYITDLNYDDAVRLSAENAEKYGWVIIQDTAWEGYREIPIWIMQGYATMAAEAIEQLRGQGIEKPTHIFLQAGVGSYAGAIQGFFASIYPDKRPVTVIVEPTKANCLYLSAIAGDGRPRKVTGDMDTIMAGLACGEPNPIAWDILKDHTDMFITCSDDAAAYGMRMLGNPLGNDPRVISGESGAVTAGILSFLMREESLKQVKELLGLDKNSTILLFNTEGDTDPEHYRKVVWDGKYPCLETADAR